MHHRATIEYRPDANAPRAMHLLHVSGTIEDGRAYLTHVSVAGDSTREDILGAFSHAALNELGAALVRDAEALEAA